jgi:hypothetical protein
MNTPSLGFQQYGEGLVNKFQSSRVGQMFGGKSRKKVDEQNDNQESVQKGNNKDAKYSAVPPGKVEKLKINESESDILANMYNFMAKNYKRDLERMKKDKKYRKDIEDFEGIRNKQLVSGLGKKNKKEKETKGATKGFSVGSLLKGGLKAGLAVGGLFLVGKAFAKMSEFDMKDAIPDITKIFKDPEKETTGTPVMGGENARKTIESYYGKPITDKEYDLLLRTVGAEADSDKIGIARTMATILNRAKEGGKFGEGIEGVIRKEGQFQAASGTFDKKTGKWSGESKLFKEGPSGKRLGQIEESVSDVLPNVPRNQLYFTATNLKAYGPGTNPEFMKSPIFAEGAKFGGQIYNAPATSAEIAASQSKRENKVAIAPQPKMDDTKLAQLNQSKLAEKRDEVVGLVKNNVIVVEKTKTVNTAEEVDDTSMMLRKIREQFSQVLR